MPLPPTSQTYSELQTAFDHFNDRLYGGQLPPCLITLQREKRTYGYYSASRFVDTGTGETVDEIALNPSYFAAHPILETLQTLCHEMAHQWQEHFGNPGRRRYHNKEWGAKMESIGLMPSSTGKPGGKRTGEQMMDYAIEGGAFEKASQELLTNEYRLSWVDRFPAFRPMDWQAPTDTMEAGAPGAIDQEPTGVDDPPATAPASPPGAQWVSYPAEGKPAGKSNRVKYRCPSCGAQAWGKPALLILCGQPDCQKAPFLSAADAGDDSSAAA